MTQYVIIPIRRPAYRWTCDYCEAWETFGGPDVRHPLADATRDAKRHIADEGNHHSVTIVRLIRWIEPVTGDRP